MTSSSEHLLSYAAVGTTVASITGWIQGNISVLASALSVVWLTFQIILAVQNQIDRRRMLRLQAVSDTHAMNRADAITRAVVEKEVPVVAVVAPVAPTVVPVPIPSIGETK